MTSLSRRRWIAPSLALTLAVGVVGALTGPASAATTTFSQANKLFVGGPNYQPINADPITIADDTKATPYPSDINVTHQGAITDLNVQLTGINHAYPDDMDVMLVGPQGQQVTLMSDAGGGDDLTGVNLTFDDSAAGSLPDSTQISSGTFKPTDFDAASDVFPAPAPASNHNTSLAVFNGTSPVGAWHLYVRDDDNPDTGFITSWRLIIDQDSTPYPSTVTASGLPAISDVNVKLTGLTSTYPDDLRLLLVGPGGQQATIVGAVGGSDDVTGVNLTLDDEAATALPDETTLTSGTYKPTNYDGVNVFPAPAPVATGLAPLSVFDGTIPNGVWSLYPVDNGSDDLVEIDGWSLDFTWADTVSPSGAVVVNGGASSTSSQNVTLSLNATDPAPSSGLTQMRFSNDGTTFSAYQPYATSAAWTLSAGEGAKTVYAQFRDADGNQSAVASDTITFALPDTTGPTVTKTTPKKNATDVKVTTKVKVKVSEALKGSTVTKKTVFLKAKGSSDKVKAKVTYNSSKKMIVLTPTKALKKNKKYNVTVTTKVKDVAGNAFDAKPGKSGAQALKFSFTTA